MRRLLVILAAVSLLLAGCGGGSKQESKPLTKAEYQAKLQAITKDIGSKLQATTSGSKKPTQKDIEAVSSGLDTFANELEAVTPPTEVAQAHKDMIAALRGLGKDLPGILDQLDKAKDPSAAIAALFGAPAIQNLVKVQQEFKKQGYDLNLNG